MVYFAYYDLWSRLQVFNQMICEIPSEDTHKRAVWTNRNFVTFSNQTGLYTKTEEYLKGAGLTGNADGKV